MDAFHFDNLGLVMRNKYCGLIRIHAFYLSKRQPPDENLLIDYELY